MFSLASKAAVDNPLTPAPIINTFEGINLLTFHLLLLDLVRSFTLQHGHLKSSMFINIAHSVHRFSPEEYFSPFCNDVCLNCKQIPLQVTPNLLYHLFY